jgi:hypothetical protein
MPLLHQAAGVSVDPSPLRSYKEAVVQGTSRSVNGRSKDTWSSCSDDFSTQACALNRWVTSGSIYCCLVTGVWRLFGLDIRGRRPFT